MSNFKYCPICGEERIDKSQFCHNCDFEFLKGKYIKLDGEKSKKELKKKSKKPVEKISPEEFVEANENIKSTHNKINLCIYSYLNSLPKTQLNGLDIETLFLDLDESNDTDSNDLKEIMENIEKFAGDDEFLLSKINFINWIDDNRGHFPGFVLNQYRAPLLADVNSIETVVAWDIEENELNSQFKKLLADYLEKEKEFLNRLI